MQQQPPNENGASYHEDRQRAEAPPDPPLSDEKTELLLEEREHGNVQYPTSVHLTHSRCVPMRSKVTNGDQHFPKLCMLRLNRDNFAVPCGRMCCALISVCAFEKRRQASQLHKRCCTHGYKRKPQRCPFSPSSQANPSVIDRVNLSARQSEVRG